MLMIKPFYMSAYQASGFNTILHLELKLVVDEKSIGTQFFLD